MKAIFNREFNSYFTSMLGYVFLTIFLLLTGVMFYVVNIRFMTARMTNFFSIVNNWALFLLPLVTMRLFSEDRKQKTDQLLLTAPILAITGNLPIAETISCYVGFILLCSAILAIGAFMSSITESQIVAAVATYGVLIFTLLLGSVASNVSNEIIVKILLWLSPVQRFSDFTLGILNFEPIIYYLSITGLFLFFTVMVFERRRMR